MSRYVVSDHHLGHANIIDYCDRPFASPGEMDDALLQRHHETVTPEDTLLHLGDVAMDMRDGRETVDRFERLGGGMLVRGNHDVGLDPDNAPFPVVDACIIESGGYRFYCTHRPEDAPDRWDSWVLHGHYHDNEPEAFPFVAYDDRRVNVAVELVDDPLDALFAVVQFRLQFGDPCAESTFAGGLWPGCRVPVAGRGRSLVGPPSIPGGLGGA